MTRSDSQGEHLRCSCIRVLNCWCSRAGCWSIGDEVHKGYFNSFRFRESRRANSPSERIAAFDPGWCTWVTLAVRDNGTGNGTFSRSTPIYLEIRSWTPYRVIARQDYSEKRSCRICLYRIIRTSILNVSRNILEEILEAESLVTW